MSALLPCPMCGGKAEIWRATPDSKRRAWIACMNQCAVLISKEHLTDGEAISAWNRRTPPLPTREALTAALAVIPTGLRNQAMHLPPAMAEAAADAVLRLLGGEAG